MHHIPLPQLTQYPAVLLFSHGRSLMPMQPAVILKYGIPPKLDVMELIRKHYRKNPKMVVCKQTLGQRLSSAG